MSISKNNGQTWTVTNGNPSHEWTPFVQSLAIAGDDLLSGSRGGGIFLSTDEGNNWSSASSGIYAQTVNSLVVMPGSVGGVAPKLIAATGYGGGVFVSSNNGCEWTHPDSSHAFDYGVQSLYVDSGNLFAAAGGVFLSTDAGAVWTLMAPDCGWPVNGAMSLTSIGTHLFVGTSSYGGFDDNLLRRTYDGSG